MEAEVQELLVNSDYVGSEEEDFALPSNCSHCGEKTWNEVHTLKNKSGSERVRK